MKIFPLALAALVFSTPLFAQTIQVVGNNVGIGTAGPGMLLDIFGTNQRMRIGDGTAMLVSGQWDGATNRIESSGRPLRITTYTGALDLGHSGNPELTIASGGNVGIGTTSPQAKLHIDQATGSVATRWGYSADDVNYHLDLIPVDTGAANVYWKFVNHNLSDYISMVFNQGNVGIGTVSPDSKLKIIRNSTYSAETTEGLSIEAVEGGSDSKLLLGADGANDISYIQSIQQGTSWSTRPLVLQGMGGNVGIGTTSPGYKLHVSGDVRGTRFIADTTTYADFVFKPGYKLASLTEVEAAIKTGGHLPGIPSEAEAKAHGVDLGAMQGKLLQKVEELTLHLIAQEKRLNAQQSEIRTLRAELSSLSTQN